MCLLAIAFQVANEAPVLVAANREEFYARESLPPRIVEGRRRAVCGIDARAGGTWLGVNERGLVVAVTNRYKPAPPEWPRSRGLLCRELLEMDNARAAVEHAAAELTTNRYDGANFMCVDADSGAVLHAAGRFEVIDLSPGLHLLAAGDLNDPHDPRLTLARREFGPIDGDGAGQFLQRARKVLAIPPGEHGQGIVIRRDNRGTVSSTLLSLADDPRHAEYWFAPGAPDQTAYEDYSPLLKDLLG